MIGAALDFADTGEDTRREQRDQKKKKLAAIDKLSVGIDGVLFSDGSLSRRSTPTRARSVPILNALTRFRKK